MPPAQENSIEAEAGGVKVKATGERVATYVLVSIIGAVFAWAALKHHDGTETNHREVQQNHREVKEALSEVTYVLSLSQERRERLRLEMPDSMRRKVRQGDRE